MTQPMTAIPNDPAPSTVESSDILFEEIEGTIRELPPMGVYEVWMASQLARMLGNFVEDQDLGHLVTEMLFDLKPKLNRKRRPDVAFVSQQRWPLNRPFPREGDAWPVIPDLAVEIVSPKDYAVELYRKIQDYFYAGSRAVWVIYPEAQHVHVFENATSVHVLTETQDLDGGAVLSGFRLPLVSLFGSPGSQS